MADSDAESVAPGATDSTPAVALRWTGKLTYGGVPTQGRGPGGALSPAEVQAYFPPALYHQATTIDHSYDPVLDSAAPAASSASPAGAPETAVAASPAAEE